jgi:Arc/MetJ family transcription regulator
MPTNLAIDDVLLEKALAIGGHRTKRDTVNEALKDYTSRRKRLGSLRTFGTIDFDPKCDHKRARKKR